MLGTVTSFERSLRYGDKNNDVPLYSRDRFLKGETFITCWQLLIFRINLGKIYYKVVVVGGCGGGITLVVIVFVAAVVANLDSLRIEYFSHSYEWNHQHLVHSLTSWRGFLIVSTVSKDIPQFWALYTTERPGIECFHDVPCSTQHTWATVNALGHSVVFADLLRCSNIPVSCAVMWLTLGPVCYIQPADIWPHPPALTSVWRNPARIGFHGLATFWSDNMTHHVLFYYNQPCVLI